MLEHRLEDLQRHPSPPHTEPAINTATARTADMSAEPGDDSEGAGALPPRRGRRAPVSGISEPVATAAIDAFCAHVGESMADAEHAHSARLRADCDALMTRRAAHALEQRVFQEGPHSQLRLLWCVELAGVCSTHEVINSGEL
jgi:hypothetical protein